MIGEKKTPGTETISGSSLLAKIVRVLDLYEGGSPLVSCQGQGMDGYSALAEFLSVAEEVREYMDSERNQTNFEEIEN